MNRFLSDPTIYAQVRLRKLKSPAVFRNPNEIIRENEYLESQNYEFMSHESQNQIWMDGQKRFIELSFRDLDPKACVLDIACGDGIGLAKLQSMGFYNVFGVDSNSQKIMQAKKHGKAFVGDMHQLGFVESGSVDIILCSHSLEHVFDPYKVLQEFKRVLTKNGTLMLVLPFPDFLPVNDRAHLAKYILGLHRFDHGRSLKKYLKNCGFKVQKMNFDSFREDEIWVTATPIQVY